MPEIERGEVEEVDDQHELGNPEMSVHPEHDEAKVEQVVCNKVGTDIGSGVDILARVEMVHVGNLKSNQDDPVDVDDDMIQRERGWVEIILAPDGVVGMSSRCIPGEVNGGNEEDEPGNEG